MCIDGFGGTGTRVWPVWLARDIPTLGAAGFKVVIARGVVVVLAAVATAAPGQTLPADA
jgi:hypothetical protein